MKLIDLDNIDFVEVTGHNESIIYRKGDKAIECTIGAPIIQAISLDRIKQARKEIKGLSQFGLLVGKSEVLNIIDELIVESESN